MPSKTPEMNLIKISGFSCKNKQQKSKNYGKEVISVNFKN